MGKVSLKKRKTFEPTIAIYRETLAFIANVIQKEQVIRQSKAHPSNQKQPFPEISFCGHCLH
jgi:hypothetical protein